MSKPYTTDSLTYALVRHGARFARSGESLRRPWTIETRIGHLHLTDAECHAYICGLADMRLDLAQEAGPESFSASMTRAPGGHLPQRGDGTRPRTDPQHVDAPDHWTPWLARLDKRRPVDPLDVARELADALANAGFEGLAQAI